MKSVKFSSKMNEETWEALRKVSRETHRSLSGLLREAVEDYLARRTLRSEVLDHADDSIRENEELLRLLAK